MNKDLTAGKPSSVLWRFCLPLFGSVIFQQLYNLADSFVAGQYIGENALAAVGNSYEITMIFLAFAFGCNIGCSVLTSQLFGAGDHRRMKTAVSTAMISTGVLCLTLMVLGIFGSGWLLGLIRTPAELLADSKLYLDIYVWGLPFLFFYNIATGIFSALGDSKTPFCFLAASSLANIFMDILFVKTFSMGVAGVAWATFLCQGVSCLLALAAVLRRLRTVETAEKTALFSREMLRQFARLAVPSILQQSFVSVGNIFIQGIINGFGPAVMAGYAAAIKLNNLVISSFATIGNGISNYTAQNLGAGKTDRIRAGFRAGCGLVWAISLPFAAAYFLLGPQLLGVFLENPTATALATGRTLLQIVAPFYFVVSVKLVSDGILRGTGQMSQFMLSTLLDLAARVLLALLFSATALGATGIWLSWPLGWILGTALSVLFYRRRTWQHRLPI